LGRKGREVVRFLIFASLPRRRQERRLQLSLSHKLKDKNNLTPNLLGEDTPSPS
jgi:hypothetical protein